MDDDCSTIHAQAVEEFVPHPETLYLYPVGNMEEKVLQPASFLTDDSVYHFMA
jgi:hypothetical protein